MFVAEAACISVISLAYLCHAYLFEIICCCIVTLYWYRNNAIFGGYVDKSIKRVAPHYPLIGTLPLVLANRQRILQIIYEVSKMYNYEPVLVTVPLMIPMLITNDPKNVEHMLKTNFENYVKGDYVHARLTDVLGNGIFVSDGEDWKVMRKTASYIFNTKSFRNFVETVFLDEMKSFKKKLSEIGSEVVDLQDLFFRFTLDSFAIVGFGAEINSMQNGKVPFADSFDRLQILLNERFFNPIWRITEWWPSTRAEYLKDVSTIFDFGNNMVKKRRAESCAGKMDLLSLFMNAKDKNGENYSDRALVEHVLNFIIAGRDTTAQALSWTIYHLFSNPTTMTKLIEEIDSTLGDQEIPTYEQIRNMKYANAVFHEAIRLHPPVPKNFKVAVNHDIMPDGTKIDPGVAVVYSTYAMGRRTSIWGPDAEQFKPERWLDGKVPSQFEYAVFNAGPRICLGKSFAELEGVFVLVSLLKAYKIEDVNLENVECANSLTIPMKNGLLCRIAARQ